MIHHSNIFYTFPFSVIFPDLPNTKNTRGKWEKRIKKRSMKRRINYRLPQKHFLLCFSLFSCIIMILGESVQ